MPLTEPQQAFVELCTRLRELGATEVVEGPVRAVFGNAPRTAEAPKPRVARVQGNALSPEEKKLVLEREREKELSRV